MRATVLYYILYNIVYFGFADDNMYWALFNALSLMYVICFFLYSLSENKRYKTTGFLPYIYIAILLTILRAIYSTACAHSSYEWIYSANKFFAAIITICLLITTILKPYKN